MSLQHYIAYSPDDARTFTDWLVEALAARGISTWFAERDLAGSDRPAETVDNALRLCKSLIVVLTPRALMPGSRAESEWRRAISFSKPITFISAVAHSTPPFALQSRRCIDFLAEPEAAASDLAARLRALDTPEGQIASLAEQISDSERDLLYAPEPQKRRMEDELRMLREHLEAARRSAADQNFVSDRVARGLERQRQPVTATPVVEYRVRFVNRPPAIAPAYFRDRFVETQLIGSFIRDPARRLATISGPGGVGKTALVCRILAALENGELPDEGGKLRVGGIVYMSAAARTLTLERLLSDLLQLVAVEARAGIMAMLETPQATVLAKLKALLPHLPEDRVIVLLDNFEDMLTPETLAIDDPDLRDVLRYIIDGPAMPLKVIVTTRVEPADFVPPQPARQLTIWLDRGLPSPHSEEVLKQMDADGRVGLRDANDSLLRGVTEYTKGLPRALEAFYAVLASDPRLDIEQLLAAPHADEQITRVLVGEAFSRLLPVDQAVMQALAVFGHAVTTTAIDFLLLPWVPYVDAANSVKRLLRMHLIRREHSAYYLHPIDREHALSTIPGLSDAANGTAFDRPSLCARAADYYREVRRPQEEWTKISDIEPHLNEFRLRLDAGEDDAAAEILSEVEDFLDRRGGFEQKLILARELERYATSSAAIEVALKNLSSTFWRAGRLDDAVEVQSRLIEHLMSNNASNDKLFIARGNRLIYQASKRQTATTVNELKDFRAVVNDSYPWASQQRMSVTHHIADALAALGYLDEALREEQHAFDEAQARGDLDEIEAETHNFAERLAELGRRSEARKWYRDALKLAERSGNPLWKANHLAALAAAEADGGNNVAAFDLISSALKIRAEIGDLGGTARNRCAEARQLFVNGNDGALSAVKAALDLAADLNQPLHSYQTTYAEILLHAGRLTEALAVIRDALDTATDEESDALWERENLHGIISWRLGHSEAAAAAFSRALASAQKWLGRCKENAAAHTGAALAFAGLTKCGQIEAAREAMAEYAEARRLDSSIGVIRDRIRLFDQLCHANLPPTMEEIRIAISGTSGEDLHSRRKRNVFISYAHKDDRVWLDRLVEMLKPIVRNGSFIVWNDHAIKPGADWRKEIDQAMCDSRAAILLVSPAFAASDFIATEEVPYLLQRAKANEVGIFWLLVRQAPYEECGLDRLQCANDPERPLNQLTEAEVDATLKRVAIGIKAAMQSSSSTSATP